MICKSCAEAGDRLAEGKKEQAEELHAKCVSPETCPCHHQTESIPKEET